MARLFFEGSEGILKLMKCPKCEGEMVLRNRDYSFDFKASPKKRYRRRIYCCRKDDVWVTVETPLGEK